MNSAVLPDDLPIESKTLTRGVRSAQAQIEGRNHEIRKNILKYDDVMSDQRLVIFKERRRVLDGEEMRDQVVQFIDDVVSSYVRAATLAGSPDDWDLDALWKDLRTIYPVSLTVDEVVEEAGGLSGLSTQFLERELTADARVQYDAVEERIDPEIMRQVERQVLLQVLDSKWREHLYEMDYLKEGIGLRAMGQRDPLTEYQREGYQLFEAMTDSIKEQSVQVLFRVEKRLVPAEGEEAPVPAQQAQRVPTMSGATSTGGTAAGGAGGMTMNMGALTYSGPAEDGSGAAATKKATPKTAKPADDGGTFPGTAKNAPCPCGSGKKYKMCHGKNEAA
jgi:preprotein translocase subunit SecA